MKAYYLESISCALLRCSARCRGLQPWEPLRTGSNCCSGQHDLLKKPDRRPHTQPRRPAASVTPEHRGLQIAHPLRGQKSELT